MMVVGGRVHTASFDEEMSKSVRLCVTTVSLSKARELMSCVCLAGHVSRWAGAVVPKPRGFIYACVIQLL